MDSNETLYENGRVMDWDVFTEHSKPSKAAHGRARSAANKE